MRKALTPEQAKAYKALTKAQRAYERSVLQVDKACLKQEEARRNLNKAMDAMYALKIW